MPVRAVEEDGVKVRMGLQVRSSSDARNDLLEYLKHL